MTRFKKGDIVTYDGQSLRYGIVDEVINNEVVWANFADSIEEALEKKHNRVPKTHIKAGNLRLYRKGTTLKNILEELK